MGTFFNSASWQQKCMGNCMRFEVYMTVKPYAVI
jgi:hypothetical protein